MENWGLITYREASLLYNEKTDTIANKRRVSLVVAHELAHQWVNSEAFFQVGKISIYRLLL